MRVEPMLMQDESIIVDKFEFLSSL
jgi:hypothetical protein